MMHGLVLHSFFYYRSCYMLRSDTLIIYPIQLLCFSKGAIEKQLGSSAQSPYQMKSLSNALVLFQRNRSTRNKVKRRPLDSEFGPSCRGSGPH